MEAEASVTLALLSPPEDAYFFPFLEVFLRRVMPDCRTVVLHPGDGVPFSQKVIVVAFPENLRHFKLPEGGIQYILLGEGGEGSSSLLGRIVFSWQDAASTLWQKFCAGKANPLFVGDEGHPLFLFLGEIQKSEHVIGGSPKKQVLFVDRASRVHPFLERNEKSFLSLVVLEATAEMLFALWEGKIDAVVDTKPSEVARCIAPRVNDKIKMLLKVEYKDVQNCTLI